jgi:serine/threonine protein kinase
VPERAPGCDNAGFSPHPQPPMTPAAPDDDRTQITPPPGRRPAAPDLDLGSGEAPAGFDKTQVYTPPPPPRPPAQDMGNGLPVGTRLHEFEITKLLGEGGFGIVYLATDTMLKRRVAVKEYMPSSLAARTEQSQVQVKSERYRETFDAGMKSFINEAQLLASFEHQSLVKVYRFWEQNGTAYMVMPFYEGKNLRDTLRSMPAAPDETWLRTLLEPLTEALAVIHAQNCYHRDIAPDNVMMLADTNKPLLLDFGAARRVIGDMTQALTVILKPGYAPVEQYAEIPGMKQGAWTDVYALAAVVHYAITGRTPPPSVGRLLNDTYQPLAQVAAGRYSAGFLAAVDHALAVRPEARTQSIAQFRDEMGLTGVLPPAGVAPSGRTASAWSTAARKPAL